MRVVQRALIACVLIASLGVSGCATPLATPGPPERSAALGGPSAQATSTPGDEPPVVPEEPIDVGALEGVVVTHGARTGRMVAITLDDGPSKESQAVLDVVEAKKAPLTLFYIGRRVLTNSRAATRAVSLGCELGDHTTRHVELVGLPASKVRDEIMECSEILEKVTGKPPVWVRPRGGKSDAVARQTIRDIGMGLVLWDDVPGDTIPSPTAAIIAKRAVDAARPGSIILLHETNPATLQALPLIIDGLRKRGLEPVTLSTLLGPVEKAAPRK
jgi:peptidoglycan-N-acetylglucosamine deacetylase